MQNKIRLNPIWIIVILGLIGLIMVIRQNSGDPFSTSLYSQQNQVVELNQFLTKQPLVLAFWGSWCIHCEREVSALNELQQKHPEVKVIGIQVDNGLPNQVFQTAHYLNLNGAENGIKIMHELGNISGGIPFLVFIDKQGKVISQTSGETSFSQLEQQIQSFR